MIGLLAIAAALLLVIAGCAPTNDNSAQESTAPEAPESQESAPIQETDKTPIATPSTTGALHMEGAQLTGEHGEPVQLRGISTHGLSWFPQYVNPEFFSELRTDWKANVVRLAMYTAESGGYCTDSDKTSLKQLVTNGVNAATNADLYAIIDWHILSDSNPLQHIDEAKVFFSEMSATFSENNNVIYEICNEPNGGTSWADIKTYATEVIPIIRANSPDAVIVVGTPTWSQDVDKAAADPLVGEIGENVMYALHFYAATHQQDLRDKLSLAVDGGLPVFVTEFGICDASGNGSIDYESADQWVALMDSLDVSYICWNLSNKNEASALFKPDCSKISGFTKDDLSAEGVWLQSVLSGDTPQSAQGAIAGAGASGTAGTPGATAGATDSQQGTTLPAGAPAQSVEASEGAISLTANVVNSWEADGNRFYQYSGTLTNNGSSVNGWQIALSLGTPFTLTDSWNGRFSVAGSDLQIANVEYNGQLGSGASVSDISFIICT